MKLTSLFVLSIIIIESNHAFSQSIDIHTTNPNNSIIPPSPNAASLIAYSEVPVSKYTGVPDISIPIYTIKSKTLQLPVTLSYHAGGIKVAQEASWVGLGWALSAGGTISRAVRGGDDLAFGFSPNPDYISYPMAGEFSETDQSEFRTSVVFCAAAPGTPGDVIKGRDTQPDLFYYNFSGYSGKFIIEKGKTLPGPWRATILDESNLVIELICTDLNDSGSWNIIATDGNGIKYFFETKETSFTAAGQRTSAWPEFDVTSDVEDLPKTITSWYLDRIEAPDGDGIMFSYESPAANQFKGAKSQVSQTHAFYNTSYPSAGLPPAHRIYNYAITVTQEVFLKGISFRGGLIEFYTGNRQDILSYGTYQPQKLDSIKVTSHGGNSISKIQFDYDYFNGPRLKLTKLRFSNKNEQQPPYIFTYNPLMLPAKTSTAIDHWGYYNGASDSQELIPEMDFANPGQVIFSNGGNRNADEATTQACILTDVQYPVGYKVHFDYEINKIYHHQQQPVYERMDTVIEASKDLAGNPSGGVNSLAYVDFYMPADSGMVELMAYSHSDLIGCNEEDAWQLPPDNEDHLYGILVAHKDIDSTWEHHSVRDYYEFSRKFISLFTYADGYIVYDPATGVELHRDLCYYGYPTAHKKVRVMLKRGWYKMGVEPYNGFSANISLSYEYITGYTNTYERDVGGLRLKRISVIDRSDTTLTYRYSYNRTAGGVYRSTGRLMTYPFYRHYKMFWKDWYNESDGSVSSRSAPYSILESTSWNPLSSSAQGSYTGYDEVTEYFGKHSENENGWKVSRYINAPDVVSLSMRNIPSIPDPNNGKLSSETTYDAAGNIVKNIAHTYAPRAERFIPGLVYESSPVLYRIDNCETYSPSQYFTAFYNIKIEWSCLVNTLITEQGVDTYIEYVYNPVNKLIAREVSRRSNGRKLIKRYKYPVDYAPTVENGIFASMVGYHITDPLVEAQVWEEGSDTRLLSSSVTRYVHDGDAKFFPAKFYSLGTRRGLLPAQFGNENPNANAPNAYLFFDTTQYHLEYEQRFDEDGFVKEVVLPGNQRTSYLWDYAFGFPAVKADNASHGEVYFDDFENNSGAVTGPAHSGRQFWNGDYTIQFAPPNSKNYKISYWYRENGQWKFSGESNFTGTMSTISQGEAIDNVRIYPEGARLTTYTYDLLVGLTSSDDVNNVATYYEYDQLNRLMRVRDQHGNFLKTFEYRYRRSTD